MVSPVDRTDAMVYGWTDLTINGISVPAAGLSFVPKSPPTDVSPPGETSFTVRIKLTRMETRRFKDMLFRRLSAAWIFHQWKHIQRNCGPGGHRNSKTSRRLIRALQGAI